MSSKRLALTHTSGVSMALLFFPGEKRLQLLAGLRHDGARTNRHMTVEKETDNYADWKIVERPKTAAASILPPTSGDADPVLSPS